MAAAASSQPALVSTAGCGLALPQSDQAIASAAKEGGEQLENLREHGMFDVKRAVTCSAEPLGDASAGGAAAGGETKVLHLIRHGQGFHNLLGDIYRQQGIEFASTGLDLSDNNPYRRPELVDPPLTYIGRQQAASLQSVTKGLDVELIVVSPLVRATQTALGAFAHVIVDDGRATTTPFVAHEGCREPGGVHTCDQRWKLSDLKREFPRVDYTEVTSEEDTMWQ